MILTLLLCTALIALILLAMRTRTGKEHGSREPPVCSSSLPIIGVLHMLTRDPIKLWKNLQITTADTNKQGGVVKTNVGFETYYLITDPEDATTVANICLEKHYAYKFLNCVFGESLLTAPVPIWTRHRKLLNPAFSLPMIHGFMEIFNGQAKALVKEFKKHAGKGPFKASSYIQNNVLKGACLAAYGGSNLHNEDTFEIYVNAYNEVMYLATQRTQKLWQYSDFMYRLCGGRNKIDKVAELVTKISNEIIQKAQRTNNALDDRQVDVKTFLDIFLKISADNTLTTKELREELGITIAAAFDTTANQFETILILLGTYPKIQERVFNEIILEIGLENDIVKEDLRKLVYTDAVIKEALRFQPVAPLVGRTLERDVKLKHSTLRKGGHALLLLYGINRHSSWGADADLFRPERWLEPGGVPDIPSAFATFSCGKRNCIGKTYALTSLKVTLAHLVRKYYIAADYTKTQYKIDLILKPEIGSKISLISRSLS